MWLFFLSYSAVCRSLWGASVNLWIQWNVKAVETSRAFFPSFKVFICLQRLIDHLVQNLLIQERYWLALLCKHRKPQIKTPASDPEPQALETMGLRQEIVRVNNGTDNHTLLTQTDWKLKHQPQRKICKEIRECSGALYSWTLVLALTGPVLAKTSRKAEKYFCKLFSL